MQTLMYIVSAYLLVTAINQWLYLKILKWDPKYFESDAYSHIMNGHAVVRYAIWVPGLNLVLLYGLVVTWLEIRKTNRFIRKKLLQLRDSFAARGEYDLAERFDKIAHGIDPDPIESDDENSSQ